MESFWFFCPCWPLMVAISASHAWFVFSIHSHSLINWIIGRYPWELSYNECVVVAHICVRLLRPSLGVIYVCVDKHRISSITHEFDRSSKGSMLYVYMCVWIYICISISITKIEIGIDTVLLCSTHGPRLTPRDECAGYLLNRDMLHPNYISVQWSRCFTPEYISCCWPELPKSSISMTSRS
jgi:hypothetical protein